MSATNKSAASGRLKSRKLIDQLFKEGKGFTVFPVRLVYLPAEKQEELLTAGFSVSSRNFTKAVHRNRIKRLMREAFRLQKQDLLATLEANQKKVAVFFIYTGKDLPDYPTIFEKLGLTLTRLIKSIG